MMTTMHALLAALMLVSAEPRMGINLGGPSDWGTELPLVDVFRLSRQWISQREGQGWGKGPALSLDARGWVTKLEPGCHVDTPMCTIERGGHYPAGRYVVLYEGSGTFHFWGSARIAEQQPGRIAIDVDPTRGPIWLRITAVDPDDYLRNIRVLMPGHEATHAAQPWREDFIERWRGMACLRFMDMMHTNHSPLRTWSDRPTMQSAHWTGDGGLPIEMLCDLANRIDADAWFCVPHMADDDFVRRFAELVKAKLDPQRKVYVEYSNEVWNGMFAQHRYAAEQGERLGFDGKPWERAWKYTARRSVEIFAIWEDVFGGTDRLVRVLPTQAVNLWSAKRIIGFEDAYKHADALAIAPYLGWTPNESEADAVVAMGLDGVFETLSRERLGEIAEVMRKNKALADAHGLDLIAYEAGQHLVGVGAATNNEALTELFQAANADPRMGDVYKRYYRAWETSGGGLMCHFSSIGRWSKWGSWGLMQFGYDEQPTAKFNVTIETMRAWNGQKN